MLKYLGIISMIGASATFSRLFLLADGYAIKHKTISKLVLHEKIAKKAFWSIVLWATIRLVYFGYLLAFFDIFHRSLSLFFVGMIVITAATITALVPVSKNLLIHRISAFTSLISLIIFSFGLQFGILDYSSHWMANIGYSIPILLLILPYYFGVIKKSLGYLELAAGMMFFIWDVFLLMFFF